MIKLLEILEIQFPKQSHQENVHWTEWPELTDIEEDLPVSWKIKLEILKESNQGRKRERSNGIEAKWSPSESIMGIPKQEAKPNMEKNS